MSALGRMRRWPLRLNGMDCPSCAATIETAVNRLPGVGDVRVNCTAQILDSVLDEGATPRADLEERITGLGYGVVSLPTAADLARAHATGTNIPVGGASRLA